MMSGAIRYIKFSEDYDKFYDWKDKTKAIAGHNRMLKYLTKKRDIPKEEDAKDDAYLLKIYEGNIKAWYFSIIILSDIPLGMARH